MEERGKETGGVVTLNEEKRLLLKNTYEERRRPTSRTATTAHVQYAHARAHTHSLYNDSTPQVQDCLLYRASKQSMTTHYFYNNKVLF